MADPQAGANPAAKAKSVGTSPSHIYKAAIDGYAANLSAAQLAKVKADPAVDYVVPDDPLAVSAVGKTPPPPAPAQQAQVVPFAVTRVGGLKSPTAKIDGIDERVNVDVAVLDSGIDVTHPDLNVVGGINCTNGKSFADTGGHGTRVAGTLAAIDNAIGVVGIAPGARLWSVRVLNDNGVGSTSAILCGIDWITAHPGTIRVANMSFAGKGSDDGNCGMTKRDPWHQGICAAVAAGVTVVAGAGNGAADTAATIAASYDEVITLSGIADSDGAPGGL